MTLFLGSSLKSLGPCSPHYKVGGGASGRPSRSLRSSLNHVGVELDSKGGVRGGCCPSTILDTQFSHVFGIDVLSEHQTVSQFKMLSY